MYKTKLYIYFTKEMDPSWVWMLLLLCNCVVGLFRLCRFIYLAPNGLHRGTHGNNTY